MELSQTLDKLLNHSEDFHGVLLRAEDNWIWHAEGAYEMVDGDQISEAAEVMLNLTEPLAPSFGAMDELFLEYENHVLYLRRLDGAALGVVVSPMTWDTFRKQRIALNLFAAPLSKAVKAGALAAASPATEQAAPAPEASAEPTPEPEAPKKQRFYRGVAY